MVEGIRETNVVAAAGDNCIPVLGERNVANLKEEEML